MAACTPAAAPHATPQAASVTVPVDTSAAPNAGPDLSPVSRPASVFLVARTFDPTRTIDTLDKLVKFPEALRSIVDGKRKNDDLEFIEKHASLDVALAVDPASPPDAPRMLGVMSVPIHSVDEAIARADRRGDEHHPTSPGAERVFEKSTKNYCDLTPSLGDSPARAICSDNPQALLELTPWMARGLAAEPRTPADAWARFDSAPLQPYAFEKQRFVARANEIRGLFAKDLGITDASLLDAPGAAASAYSAFSEDLDSVEASLTFDADKPEVRVHAAIGFRSRKSWFTEVLASAIEKPEGPPEMFARLPIDASVALWGRAPDPALFRGIRSIAHDATSILASHPRLDIGLDAADRRSLLQWIDTIPVLEGEWVHAGGFLPFRTVAGTKAPSRQAVDDVTGIAQSFLPWGVNGGEGDPAAFAEWLKSTADVFNRTIAAIRKRDHVAAQRPHAAATFLGAPPGLPKGSAALDVDIPFLSDDVWDLLPANDGKDAPKGPAAKGHLTLRLAVVPDGPGHYWWGYAPDPAALTSRLNAVLKGAPASGTIGSRRDLDALETQVGFGGFVTLGPFLANLSKAPISDASERKALSDALAIAPHGWDAPIYFSGSGSTGSTPTMSVDLVLGRDLLADASAVAHDAPKLAADLDTPPPIAKQPVPDKSVGDATGIAECDQYIHALEACAAKIPAMRDVVSSTRDAFRTAGRDKKMRDSVAKACRSASQSIATTCK